MKEYQNDYKRLSAAVILQAIKDLKKPLGSLNKAAKAATMKSARDFLQGDMEPFSVLSEVNSDGHKIKQYLKSQGVYPDSPEETTPKKEEEDHAS
jgi:hypothetical protein